MSKLDKRAISTTLVIAIFLMSMISVLPVYAVEPYVDAVFASSGSTVSWAVDATYGDVVVLDTVGAATGSDYAIVRIDVDTDITLATIVANLPTFMYKLVTIDSADNFLALEMFFTSDGGGEAEISIFPYVSAVPWDNTDTDWQVATGHSGATFAAAYGETDLATEILEEGGSRSLTNIIAAIDALDGGAVDLSTYELTRVGVQIGWVIVPTDMVAHIDYIEVDGVTYDLEETMPTSEGFTIDYLSAYVVDYGDIVTVWGSGVTAGSEIKIFWDYASGTYAHLLNTTEGNPDGSFDCEVTVPSDIVGAHYLWVTDVATAATVKSDAITMVPKISLSPSSGLFGEEVTVKGYGFSADSDVTITFNAAVLTTAVETDELGYFAYDFDVPIAVYETYTVVATDEKGKTDSADFTVGASLYLDVEEGPEGTRIEISGIGFPEGALGDVNWDGSPMTIIGDPVTIPSSGKFTVEVIAPSTGEGEHTIMILDTVTPEDVEATFTIDGVATIEVSPTYGAPGSTITLTGANFTQIADTEVVLTLTHATLADTPLGTVDTESDGTFETTFTSPAVTFENYKVEADDAVYGLNALDSFKVGMIAMIINPTYGPSGSDVSLTGVGYSTGDFNMTFGEVLFEYPNGVDANEIIAKTFYVPTLEPGTYDVTVVDEVENELTAQFTVTAKTYVVFDPAQAPNEYDVIIEGYHFSEDPAADLEFILYNSTESWDITADVDEYDPEGDTDPLKYLLTPAELDADGNFSAWWTVPIADDLSLGDYTLNVTADDTFIQVSFSVVTARVDVAPRKALFDRGDTIQFNVKNDFDFEESYMKIWDPDDNLYWQTEVFDTWLKVGTLYTVPYYLQTSGMNPMVLQQDAPLGTWFYIFYETGTTQLTNGTFTVGPSSAAQVEQKLTEIWASMEDLSTDIDSITDEIAGDIDALSGDIDDVVADVQDMIDDITADLAEELAGVASDTEDAVDELEGAIGDIAAAQNELASELEDMGQDTAAAREAAEDAQSSASGLTTLVYGAIAASLIAALAAVVSLMQISKKIA